MGSHPLADEASHRVERHDLPHRRTPRIRQQSPYSGEIPILHEHPERVGEHVLFLLRRAFQQEPFGHPPPHQVVCRIELVQGEIADHGVALPREQGSRAGIRKEFLSHRTQGTHVDRRKTLVEHRPNLLENRAAFGREVACPQEKIEAFEVDVGSRLRPPDQGGIVDPHEFRETETLRRGVTSRGKPVPTGKNKARLALCPHGPPELCSPVGARQLDPGLAEKFRQQLPLRRQENYPGGIGDQFIEDPA
ncbi:MAG: hypothetical protein VX574_04635 [Myxococcota bacterium]|nr:hypothetical protein [Myxococcota bacterium]